MVADRMNKEHIARLIGILTVVGVIITVAWAWNVRMDNLVIHASLPEDGGWQPDVIRAEIGVPLLIQFTSKDVIHGFAVGQMENTEVRVEPGKVSQISLVFDQPGTYTFYCTRWCGANHWRMRGTIEVEGEPVTQQPSKAPSYLLLGIDIDAEHQAQILPQTKPSAVLGAVIAENLPIETLEREFYLSNTPEQMFQAIRATIPMDQLGDQQIWNLVAYLAWKQTSPEDLTGGKNLYQANCAACHGENGAGDGVFADLSNYHQPEHEQEEDALKTATNFSDPRNMLSASPALLQGKILRGGMGTGMPAWGQIFTDEQTWSLVNYLWTFQFQFP